MKQCARCGKDRDLSEFNFRDKTWTKLGSYCRTCRNDYNRNRYDRRTPKRTPEEQLERKREKSREWARKNRERLRDSVSRCRYGMTWDEYRQLMAIKSCQICGTDFGGKVRGEIDHCHETEIVRGRLYRNCKLGLGHFKDNLERLRNVVEYLSRYRHRSRNLDTDRGS